MPSWSPAEIDRATAGFINCPFDDQYRPLFRAMLFTIAACGYRPRCALEISGGGATRIGQIADLICTCDHTIHDISNVEAIDVDEGEITIGFDGRRVTFQFGKLDQVVLTYATTIHKSQGSEYPVVVTPMLTQHYAKLQRNLLYTGFTRGKRLVILVGQKKAIAIAVGNVSGRRQWTKLRDRLTNAIAPPRAVGCS